MLGRYKRKWAIAVADYRLNQFKKKFSPAFFKGDQPAVNLHLVSLCGAKYIWEQLYSISSFYCNTGVPASWSIYSDGSFTNTQIQLLDSIPFVKIITIPANNGFVAASVLDKNPLLKKIDFYSTHILEGSTIFCDSDILFFPKFKNFISSFYKDNWFLVDEGKEFFDAEYLAQKPPVTYPLNSGFFVLNMQPDWQIAKDYILSRMAAGRPIGHWSEQTAIQAMVERSSFFFPLNKELFVVTGQDSFSVAVKPNWNDIALRHFVGPIRHKMWQTNWRKVLAC